MKKLIFALFHLFFCLFVYATPVLYLYASYGIPIERARRDLSNGISHYITRIKTHKAIWLKVTLYRRKVKIPVFQV